MISVKKPRIAFSLELLGQQSKSSKLLERGVITLEEKIGFV
jgi:hypothetical protein